MGDNEFQPEKCGNAEESDDRLSRLPDEILVVILSSIPLKDAARTSVLSSRWTNTWRHSMCLNFDVDDKWHHAAKPMNQRMWNKWMKFGSSGLQPDKVHEYGICYQMRNKYVDWVNSVLQSHIALTMDEFRISYDLGKSKSEEINKWLEFAFARRVQRLELCLVMAGVWFRYSHPYEFPADYYLRYFDVKALKALCLRGVNVGGEDIELFLRNCPFLEELIVQSSKKMSKVEVSGSSLALKHLEIFYCHPLSPIKISAPKLTSLKVDTLSGLLLDNVTKLVEFNLVRDYDRDLFKHKLVHGLHCYIFQLETLTLGLNTTYKETEFLEFPEMPKLNKLVIYFEMWYDRSLVALSCLIRASPHLQEVEVKMSGVEVSRVREKGEDNDIIMHSPHQHLKVLKYSGYFGLSSDVILARYILMNCVALQKIIVDTSVPEYNDADWEETARNDAKQLLEPYIPRHIQFLIL